MMPIQEEVDHAVLPVPEAAAASPWALIAAAVGAVASVLLRRQRTKA
ncbi:hypothetical protein Aca07nite_56430 [Actinoplanes capillaceus]|uniref:PEP-CTERM protein-sorting domain-containing protein n=1 Tax=Actinoplanes campanulatus TaxID=113559 RepID=A0ABQ3WQ73_9ACTN|nr:hypothetical protein [Actinoplanes capillaceus]GID48368.1 hypothetical protein Aca07nite_56430 [Actinoplanes capillaceus]